MKKYERLLDIIHCINGNFIHVSEIAELSTEPFHSEEGLMDVLTGDSKKGDRMYAKTQDNRIMAIDLGDKFNLDRMNCSSYDYNKRMMQHLVDSWASYKYGVEKMGVEIYE